MADIGKDGNNLFQSIFHRAPGVSPSADCFNINNEDANNVNKRNDVDNQSTDGDTIEKCVSRSCEEDNGCVDESLNSDDVDSGQVVSNGSLAQSRSTSKELAANHEAVDRKCDELGVNENGLPSNSTKETICTDTNLSALKSEGTKSKCGKNRRICFPSDDFISGYHEPPDPWKNAPSCTSEELVAAYKKSCDLNATKPSAKVLQQLQSINPSQGKREEVLTLKGEKLDQRQCETIEEILRRVQFKLLDVEACHLDDECAQALFDMIEYYESACQLNISFNKNISVRGWQACARLVRRTPSLKYLDMRGCELNDRTIPLFGRALKLGCHLTILHMENMALAGRTLVILVAALKMNETLQELFLAENKLMPSDGVQLGNLVRYNHYLGLLDLRNNHLQDVGVSHICEGLLEQSGGRGLRTLVLWNNQMNYQAMPNLGKALALSETIETLNIGHNAITNEGAHLLKDGLLKTNSLLRLGLQGTRISDEGAVALAEYIADSTILLRVDLRDNDIKTGGLMALSHAMRVNTSVTRIDLDKDPKKESYMKDYAEQQGRLLRDILTFQQRNIEAALQQEEEERAELERKAQAAHAGGEGCQENSNPANPGNSDLRDNENFQGKKAASSQKSPTSSTPEAFTIIEKSEAVEECVAKSESSLLHSQEDTPENDSEECLPSFNLRPSLLFHHLPSSAQESLDSPLPFPAGKQMWQDTQSTPYSSICSQAETLKSRLNISQEAPPAEMIPSPQYVPRNVARKIFSVSRVSEDPRQSVEPKAGAGAAWDPLCASVIPVELLPCPSSNSNLPTNVPPVSLASNLPHIPTDFSDSQSDALAHSLCQVAVSESLPITPDVDNQQVGKIALPSENPCKGPEKASESTSESQSALQTAETNDTSSCADNLPSVHEQGDTGIGTPSFHVAAENTNSSGSSDSAPQKPKSCDEIAPSLQTFKEEQTPSSHQGGATSMDDELAKNVNVESSQGCGPSSLPLSSNHDSTKLQGSGDSGHQLEKGFAPSAATTSFGDGDSCRGEVKDIDPFVSFSCDSLIAQNPKQPSVVEINSDSPAVLIPAKSNSCEENREVAPPTSAEELGDEEESWLAVGKDDADGKMLSQPTSEQPDFFTTLSINGLTQELASALTSLDTAPGSSPETHTEVVQGDASTLSN